MKRPLQKINYTTGIRVGQGEASFVVFPNNLLQFWKVLKICVSLDKIIIIQAANTGLTGGSTPDGDDYDRDVVIINTLQMNKLILLNKGNQIISFPGSTLYDLENKLKSIGRGPHSVIGSSCIGASIVGGVCNNSGGNLVNRGPAYTELSLFARYNKNSELELVNNLDIDLGDTPEEIISNLEAINFEADHLPKSDSCASDVNYQERVRDINASTPSRFNADKRRLYNASGCAGKIAVFAVRLDTFPLPKKEQVFFLGSNDPHLFTQLRKTILTKFETLPDMVEYMHSTYFDGADKYCKDTFLFIKYLGTQFLPLLLLYKRRIDNFVNGLGFLPDNFSDRILQFIGTILPDHLPVRVRKIRNKYDHYMIFLASDDSIKATEELLESLTSDFPDNEYIKCNQSEGNDILLHRYVAGAAPLRFKILSNNKVGDLLPLDIAFPRNFESWDDIFTPEINSHMAQSFQMAHFLCMVFHCDFVLKKGSDSLKVKSDILNVLDDIGAKYPAEHNVGHLYKGDDQLLSFYRNLDPQNIFNSGIGKDSKNKNYR